MQYTKEELAGTGIYCILNLSNGKQYVGSAAVSFRRRWKKHRSDLHLNKHHSKYLQSSYNKYSKDSFQYIIIEHCEPEQCLVLEQYYLDSLNVCNPKFGYNSNPTAGSWLGSTHTSETKAKMSLAKTGITHSAERIANNAKAQLKTYIVTDVLGLEIIVDNLRIFCIDNNLSLDGMRKVSYGSRKSTSGGWLCRLA